MKFYVCCAATFIALGCLTLWYFAPHNQVQGDVLVNPPDGVRAKAEGGDAASQLALAEALSQTFEATDQVEAVQWYRRAAEQNLAKAQAALSVCYKFGKGVVRDDAEAVKWSRKAAEQGIAVSQLLLGECYLNGEGVAADEAEAVKWFHKAAEQDIDMAQQRLAVCYLLGVGVPEDAAEAVKWCRKAAEQGSPHSQVMMGMCYETGDGVPKDVVEAVKWYRMAVEQNYAPAQYALAVCYLKGIGVSAANNTEAIKLFRKAAEGDFAEAQNWLASCYSLGKFMPKDDVEAFKWFRKAAEQNFAMSQYLLANRYLDGKGVPKDVVEGYKWNLLAASQGVKLAESSTASIERDLTQPQIAEGQKLAREFKPRKATTIDVTGDPIDLAQTPPRVSGTGFFITDDGYFVTNAHVVTGAGQIRLMTSNCMISAKLVKADAANDLALLKAEGKFDSLPVSSSRTVKLGATVSTVGFPNIGLQGFAPKLSKGDIASLSGAEDDPRYFQISVPLQPGNSGGALVDEQGNVVGVVSAKLNAQTALVATGALPENVNYAVKSSFLLGFLESTPDVSSKLKELHSDVRAFEAIVQSTKQATVLVLVY